MNNYIVDKNQEEFSLKNQAIVKNKTQDYAKVTRGGVVYYLTIAQCSRVDDFKVGLSGPQREWMQVALKDAVQLTQCPIPKQERLVGTISLEIDFYQKPKKAQSAINTDDMAADFLLQFKNNVFCKGQPFIIGFLKPTLIKAKVLQLTPELGMSRQSSGSVAKKLEYGIIHANTRVIFEKKPESLIQLVGRHMGDSAHQALISPDWDFNQMGIGGLDKEFSDIFRRAFASRVFPPDVVEQMGMKHVRGILLYGPPGTGKTLMARQIGKMLHAREPKIINGPEILNKYVGESEANIRGLFAEADAEEKKMGIASALHIIIFDEIDAICRSRGSLSGSTGVHDTVVNQLLAKIDGVEQLNNILLIGMTNRKDMIDEALLRPGRLEVQMEIGLPDEDGRLEILNIHTSKLRKHNKLDKDVDLDALAKRTRNFSGAELEGLVRSAQATAMNKLISAKEKGKLTMTHEDADRLKVTAADFEHGLLHDIKPAFGVSDKQISRYFFNGIIPWGPQVQEVLERGKEALRVVSTSQSTPLQSLLLHGPPSCGKTALAAYTAMRSEFPFVKVISPEDMVGFTEAAKCAAINKVFENAYKSELSCIVIDDIERLLDYVAIGPRFSNLVLQTLLVLLRKLPPISLRATPHKLMIIGTTGLDSDVLELTGITSAFEETVDVSYLRNGSEILAVLQESNIYKPDADQLTVLKAKLEGKPCFIGIKRLLHIIEAARGREDFVDALIENLKLKAKLKK